MELLFSCYCRSLTNSLMYRYMYIHIKGRAEIERKCGRFMDDQLFSETFRNIKNSTNRYIKKKITTTRNPFRFLRRIECVRVENFLYRKILTKKLISFMFKLAIIELKKCCEWFELEFLNGKEY